MHILQDTLYADAVGKLFGGRATRLDSLGGGSGIGREHNNKQ
jgi:hypothetical protein